jgi:hypothetical protein
MSFAAATTESQLKDWRGGQTEAERLCGGVLCLDKYTGIDPQCPFGGPDGKKDLLCEKGGYRYVAAVYFPTGDVSFASIREKFVSDLAGAVAHKRDGFVFLTNQHLTPGERDKLEQEAKAQGKLPEIFHRERIRILLDAPSGYGLRLQHLRILMTPDEQFAYFSKSRDEIGVLLEQNIRELRRLSEKIDALGTEQSHIRRTMALVESRLASPHTVVGEMLKRSLTAPPPERGAPVTASITTGLVRLIHKFLTASPIGGSVRISEVWISDPTGKLSAPLECPPSAEVPHLLETLFDEWNRDFARIAESEPQAIILAIAKFHARFLAIHPFLDGNGRVAREILTQQCRDLLGVKEAILLERGAPYFAALRSADEGNPADLAALITKAVELAQTLE